MSYLDWAEGAIDKIDSYRFEHIAAILGQDNSSKAIICLLADIVRLLGVIADELNGGTEDE